VSQQGKIKNTHVLHDKDYVGFKQQLKTENYEDIIRDRG